MPSSIAALSAISAGKTRITFSPAGGTSSYYNSGGANRYLGTASYIKTLSPTMVNEFRFTAQRNDGRRVDHASRC